jgi:hypothetical protein
VALRIMLAYFTTDAVFPVHSPLDFYTWNMFSKSLS